MGKPFNGTERIQIFAFELIALIAQGKKETIEKIEEQITNENIVRYIRDKYRDDMTNTFEEDCPYNLDDWNKAFFGFSGYVEGNERRKWGIESKDDGLLLLLALAIELISSK